MSRRLDSSCSSPAADGSHLPEHGGHTPDRRSAGPPSRLKDRRSTSRLAQETISAAVSIQSDGSHLRQLGGHTTFQDPGTSLRCRTLQHYWFESGLLAKGTSCAIWH